MTMLDTSLASNLPDRGIMSPRDLESLQALTGHGLQLVEVRISPVSFSRGQLLSNIELPENTRIACLIRRGQPITDLRAVFLEEGDALYLLTDDEITVRDLFTI